MCIWMFAVFYVFFFKQKTAYEMRISDWSSDVCSSDLVIPARWRSSVIDDDGRVNRISYELCVLTQLRDRIRSKEIWVVGADRYRNPDDDLPKDFEIRRDAYYSGLSLTP